MAKRKVTKRKTTMKKTTKRRSPSGKAKKQYVVKATVTIKSKRLTKGDADALRTSTKRKVKGAVVKVSKV